MSSFLSVVETKLHIMANCDVSRILWFKLLGSHLHNLSFSNPMDFLETIVHENNKLAMILDPQEKLKITVTMAIII